MAAVQLLSAARNAMSYLVYCVLNGERQEPRRKLRFLGYPPASIMLRACELGVVASETSGEYPAPDVARLLAYSKVVESYNRERTVIPMRYGCIMGTLAEMRRLVEDHQREYRQLLAELDGHAEMCARVALDETRSFTPLRTDPAPQPFARFGGRDHDRPGIAYLAERTNYYARKEDFDNHCEEIRRSICGIAEGVFIRCASEYGTRGGKRILELYFLVSRSGIDAFRDALRPLTAHAGSSVAVTGPWPPYNFVRSPTAQHRI
jgi:hypothetical protein